MNRNIDIREADEMARAMNAYNERVGRAVDALLIRVARYAVSIIGGAFLGLYAIGAVWGGA